MNYIWYNVKDFGAQGKGWEDLYILDPLANMSADMVEERAENFIEIICKAG